MHPTLNLISERKAIGNKFLSQLEKCYLIIHEQVSATFLWKSSGLFHKKAKVLLLKIE